MKTHEIARVLQQLADLLRDGPNVQQKDLRLSRGDDANAIRMNNIAVNLTTLAELSRLKKAEWEAVIVHYSLPVEVKRTDSTRDLLGRLLGYLEKNPSERERIRKEATPNAAQASPELLRAFSILLSE